MDINCINLTGRLTKSPELMTTQNDKKLARFCIAVNDGYKENEKTYFFNCTAWNGLGEVVEKYCSKGDLIFIQGKLIQNLYVDNGEKKSFIEIIVQNVKLCGTKSKKNEVAKQNTTDFVMADDEELPF